MTGAHEQYSQLLMDGRGIDKGNNNDVDQMTAGEPQHFLLDNMLGIDIDDQQEEEADTRDGGYGSEGMSPSGHSGGAPGQPRRFARVDTPLRVEPPPSFNAPARPLEQTQEQQIKVSSMSYCTLLTDTFGGQSN